MSETKAEYRTNVDTTTTQWADVRFPDGKHTGVRVLRGTTIIEIMRDGRKTIVDTAACLPIDLTRQVVYTK